MKKLLLTLTALVGLTMANYSAKAETDDDGYRILHKGQKMQLTNMIYGFPNHEDLVAFQAMVEHITPEKKDAFLSSHKYLRLDPLYAVILGTEEPHRVHLSLFNLPGTSYWVDASQLPDEN
jgi:hypothetical protein